MRNGVATMQKFLVFQLYGPLASWGGVAVGGERPVAPHPGRSAILGMLAAAAGIRRDQEEQHQALEQSFGMAVRMETAGSSLNDYHTAQVPPQAALKKHPAITRRDELSTYAVFPTCIALLIWLKRISPCLSLYFSF
ncbi:MAG: type I-E CRISPR-associated protein Cas5/CasD [Candidatus Electrothrix sp. ATG2]|nr:type I-E CRISPR-associated protein Cas5/CasD [Candidatus Electrothrix sp. ATG2]